jgi:hypothetical protein
MTFKDSLAAAPDTLPRAALERVLRAVEISEHHGQGQLAEELGDPLNALTDVLSEERILSQIPDGLREPFIRRWMQWRLSPNLGPPSADETHQPRIQPRRGSWLFVF